MNKLILSFALVGILNFSLFATHYMGGEITYRQLGYLHYEATVTTYTEFIGPPSTLADRDTIDLSWGDGITSKVLRMNGPSGGPSGIPQGEIIYYGAYVIIKKSVFVASHTYGGPLCYHISVTDPNRTSDIVNMNAGNSVNVAFFTESYLKVIDPYPTCTNSSVQFYGTPVFFAKINQQFRHQINADDMDGDSLSFELVVSRQGQDFPVPNYKFPNEVSPGVNNIFSINSITGEITWDAPKAVGIYTVAAKISEWRNGWLAGYVIRDFQIIVEHNSAIAPKFSGVNSWNVDLNGNYYYTINPGDTLDLNLTYQDSIVNNVYLSSFGAPYHLNSSATFDTIITTTGIEGVFRWTPDSTDARISPYHVTFRGVSNTPIAYAKDISLLLYVTGGSRSSCQEPLYCVTGIPSAQKENMLMLAPNPFSEYAILKIPDSIVDQKELSVSIIDITGKEVRQLENLTSNQIKIEKGTLSAGLYLLSLKSKGELISTTKMIIE